MVHKRHENEALKLIITLYEQGDMPNTIIAQLFASGYQLVHASDIATMVQHEMLHLGKGKTTFSDDTARLLVRALTLFNDKPRFGPRNRRMPFDSYSVASEIETALRARGYDPRDPELAPKENE